MKIRSGFVSNSSSSSFIIRKTLLTVQQLESIRNHIAVSNEIDRTARLQRPRFSYIAEDYSIRREGLYAPYGENDESDAWEIEETDFEIHGYTSIDNFKFHIFLEEIGIPRTYITEYYSENGYYPYDSSRLITFRDLE